MPGDSLHAVEPATYVEVIRVETARLVDTARAAGLDATVPACPEWTVTDLLRHIGSVQRWQAEVVRRRATEPLPSSPHAPVDPEAMPDWVGEGAALLLAALEATPPETPMWTMSASGKAEAWFRRAAHEAALHRVDAEQSAAMPSTFDAELAADGIDEHVESFVLGRLRKRFVGDGETVHLHCTDVDGEWLVRLTPSGPEVDRAHAKGDVAARGPAADLLLALRRRRGPEAVEVFGDAALLTRFLDLARI